VKPFRPLAPRKGRLNKQRADDIFNRRNDMFNFTILRRCVWTRRSKLCAFRQEKCLGGRVVKLMPVVTLDGLDGAVELSMKL
jgi:hypothetical protein